MATKATEVSRDIFGGILDFDAAGLYPGLELLNLVFSISTGNILPEGSNLNFKKKSHDFARRLVWDYEGLIKTDKCRGAFVDDKAQNVVKSLLECLQMPIPNITKIPSWERAHFFPYCRSLIHWDARIRGNKLLLERRYLRGGGALAHKVLREDRNSSRLNKIRKDLLSLYPEKINTPLQKLAEVLAMHATEAEIRPDEIEDSSRVLEDDGQNDIFRDGVLNILSHEELSCSAKIRALINWTGFWLILLQKKRAADFAIQEDLPIIIDCGSSPGQLRRLSVKRLKEIQSIIGDSIDKAVNIKGAEPLPDKQRMKILSFFTATCATVGLLNSFKGKRHFTIGVDLLETLVLAAINDNTEMPFEQFLSEVIFAKWHLVICKPAAEQAGLLCDYDASIFEDNKEYLARQMVAAGLITNYSDATRMVSTRGLL